MNGQVYKQNEEVYKYITDLLFKELSLISWDFDKTFRDRKEMIEEYARATVLEHLTTMLEVINRDHPEILNQVEYGRLEKMHNMQRPYKELLMMLLLKDKLDEPVTNQQNLDK